MNTQGSSASLGRERIQKKHPGKQEYVFRSLCGHAMDACLTFLFDMIERASLFKEGKKCSYDNKVARAVFQFTECEGCQPGDPVPVISGTNHSLSPEGHVCLNPTQ